jgi:hypothetical protein
LTGQQCAVERTNPNVGPTDWIYKYSATVSNTSSEKRSYLVTVEVRDSAGFLMTNASDTVRDVSPGASDAVRASSDPYPDFTAYSCEAFVTVDP